MPALVEIPEALDGDFRFEDSVAPLMLQTLDRMEQKLFRLVEAPGPHEDLGPDALAVRRPPVLGAL